MSGQTRLTARTVRGEIRTEAHASLNDADQVDLDWRFDEPAPHGILLQLSHVHADRSVQLLGELFLQPGEVVRVERVQSIFDRGRPPYHTMPRPPELGDFARTIVRDGDEEDGDPQ